MRFKNSCLLLYKINVLVKKDHANSIDNDRVYKFCNNTLDIRYFTFAQNRPIKYVKWLCTFQNSKSQL